MSVDEEARQGVRQLSEIVEKQSRDIEEITRETGGALKAHTVADMALISLLLHKGVFSEEEFQVAYLKALDDLQGLVEKMQRGEESANEGSQVQI